MGGLKDRNRKIDHIFRTIRDTAQGYLDSAYPDAPDPDMFIELVEKEVKRYKEEVE